MDLRLSTLMSAKGRLTRKEYCIASFLLLLPCSVLVAIACSIVFSLPEKYYGTFQLPFYYFGLVTIIKRCHDIGRSGWVLLYYILAAGVVFYVDLLLPFSSLSFWIVGIFSILALLRLIGYSLKAIFFSILSLILLYCVLPLPVFPAPIFVSYIVAHLVLFFKDSEKGANQWGMSTKYPNGDDPRSQSFHQDYLGSPTHGQPSPSHEQRAIQQNSFHKELTSSDTEVVPPLSQNAKNIIIVVGLIFLSVIIIFGYLGCSTASKLSSPSPFPSKTSSDSSSQKNLQEIEDILKELDE